ncbi:MAG TPA: pyridoxamine 5'-phosphate oxidase family protein [Actinomycetota bacterium]|nr:pyridoxamine 5'-phosphate oxidase family protein [Actinomycetota bacterium]
MTKLPEAIEELLNATLVSELTVLDGRGRPVTYPLIPLYDGNKIYMTSSVLFSKKLEHIKRDPRVSVTISDPVAARVEPFRRATIQGLAQVVEDDLHSGWERVMPLWTAKEPVISDLVKKRFAMPLFWERSIIEIVPTRAFLWDTGETSRPPQVFELGEAA